MAVFDFSSIVDPMPIPGCAGYFATADGRLFSTRRLPNGRVRELRQFLNGCYMKVGIFDDEHKKCRQRTVHTLVLSAFAGQRPDGMCCRHLDGNHLNNHADNLCWGTVQENCDDKTKHGKTPRGSKHFHSNHTELEISQLKRMYADGASIASLARKFSMSAGNVDFIVKGKTWVHVEAEVLDAG